MRKEKEKLQPIEQNQNFSSSFNHIMIDYHLFISKTKKIKLHSDYIDHVHDNI
jgi:hypothetical protein